MSTVSDRRRLFDALGDRATAKVFFDHVADDVHWTIMGTHPVAGEYTSKEQFTTASVRRLGRLLQPGVRMRVDRFYEVSDDVVVAEMVDTATAVDGQPFDTRYCWICRFDGDVIVEVRAYVDSAMVADLLYRTGG